MGLTRRGVQQRLEPTKLAKRSKFIAWLWEEVLEVEHTESGQPLRLLGQLSSLRIAQYL